MVNVTIEQEEAEQLYAAGLVDIKNVSKSETGQVQMVVEITGLAQEFHRILDRLTTLEQRK